MSVASFAASFSSLMTFLRDSSDSYVSSKSLSTSTPSLLFGRSRMWPIDATTLKSRPRYLLIVFAFAGDSTTTSAFAIDSQFLILNSEFPIPNYAIPSSPYHALSNPDESSAAGPSDETLQFELEQARQQPRRREA